MKIREEEQASKAPQSQLVVVVMVLLNERAIKLGAEGRRGKVKLPTVFISTTNPIQPITSPLHPLLTYLIPKRRKNGMTQPA